jgi:O-antigen/teichoic acid export membrane protein
VSTRLRDGLASVARNRFARNVSWLWSAHAGELVAGLVQAVVVARLLGPRGYGVAALVLAYPALVLGIIQTRTQDPAIRWLGQFHARDERDKARAFVKLCYLVDGGIAVVALAVVFATRNWAAGSVVGDDGTAALLMVYAAGLVVQSPQVTTRAVLSTLERFGGYARLTVALNLLRAATVVVLAARYDIDGVVWGNAAGVAVSGLVWATVGLRTVREVWGGTVTSASLSALRGHGREIAGFFVASDADSLLGLLEKQADVVVLGYLFSPTQVGYYRLASRLTTAMGAIVSPFETVSFPRLSRLWASGGVARFRSEVRRYAVTLGAPGAVVMLAGAILFAPLAIRLIGGEEFEPAGLTAQLLTARVATRMAFFWLVPAILSAGFIRLWMGRRFLSSALILVGYVAVVPELGIEGMAVTLLAAGVVTNAAAAGMFARRLGRVGTLAGPSPPDERPSEVTVRPR